MEQSKSLKGVGSLTAKVGRLKLWWEGLKPGELGVFEAFERLALGLQGQRLLWVILDKIQPHIDGWDNINFAQLELETVRLRDMLEERRIEVGREALLDGQKL